MKKFILLFVFFVFSISAFAQQYPEVTIQDIQYQDPATLNEYFTDDMATPLNNDTVYFTGVVMVPPYKYANPDSGVLMYAGGGALGIYLQDTSANATQWSGIFVREESSLPTGAFAQLDSGLVIHALGVVNEYATSTQKTTQINVIDFQAQDVVGQTTRPQPVVLPLDSLKTSSDDPKAIAEKWEGMLIEIHDVTTFDRTSTGAFKIQDDNGLTLNIGTKSNFFYVPSGGQDAPLDGTRLSYIRGYVETRSPGSGGITINPGFPMDLEISTFPPSITSVTRDPVIVNYGEDVTISAQLSDLDGSVDEAKVYFHVNGGEWDSAALEVTSGINYEGIIPAQNDSSFIDYFVWAVDNQGNESRFPSDTSTNRLTYFVLDHPLEIQHVQYSPFGGGYSSYNGFEVTVSGVVTTDTSDAINVYMQNGNSPWSGIRISGTQVLDLNAGDNVTVTGTVLENFGHTYIANIDNESQLTVNSTGNTIPEPVLLSTSDIATVSDGTVEAEQWESVVLKYENLTVTDENADGQPGPNGNGNSNFGEMFVADNSGVNTRVDLQDGNNDYHNFWSADLENEPIRIQTGNEFDAIIGVLTYSFGNYKLLPRTNADFIGFTDVKDENINPDKFELAQNYPNPFNPSTVISYNLPVGNNVTLKIYNVLGQEVKTLVNGFQTAGKHTVNFNAKNLTSGVYFYSIKTGDFVSVKKMMLLK